MVVLSLPSVAVQILVMTVLPFSSVISLSAGVTLTGIPPINSTPSVLSVTVGLPVFDGSGSSP